MLLTIFVSNLGSIFQVMLTIISAFSGVMGSSFVMGLFIPCVNKVVSCTDFLSKTNPDDFIQVGVANIESGMLRT